MRKRLFFSITAACVFSLTLLSCGGDDNPASSEPEYLNTINIEGEVLFRYGNTLVFNCEVTGSNSAEAPQITSLRVGDHYVPLTLVRTDKMEGSIEIVDETLAPGDEIPIVALTPHGADTCKVHLFGFETDSIVYLSWANNSPWDTVDVDTWMLVEWSPMANANRYSYTVDHHCNSTETPGGSWDGTQAETYLVFLKEENCCEGHWVFWVSAAEGLGINGPLDRFQGCGAVYGGIVSRSGSWSLAIYVVDQPDEPPA